MSDDLTAQEKMDLAARKLAKLREFRGRYPDAECTAAEHNFVVTGMLSDETNEVTAGFLCTHCNGPARIEFNATGKLGEPANIDHAALEAELDELERELEKE